MLSEREHKDDASVASSVSDAHSTTSSNIPATPRPQSVAMVRRPSVASSDKGHSGGGSSGAGEAKVALLYWVRIQLEDYIAASIIPSVQDFSRSWRTGLAFCLLLHRHDPALIPDMLTTRIKCDLSEKQTWRELLTLAFDVALTQLNIPSFLDPEDLVDVEYPYEPSVMMYVAEYYKVMSKAQKEEDSTARYGKTMKRRAAIAMAVGCKDEEIQHEEDPPRICDSPVPAQEDGEEAVIADPISEITNGSEEIKSPIKPIDAPTTAVTATSKAPLEAPVPVPIPSARRTRRKLMLHQRESTLAEEDKARIKADLNSRLMKQLTGHLPRGVHPVLDELLAIHDTVTSFIKTNTRTIDEIPEEFTGSSSLTEYVDALEIIEEQMSVEADHLDTAKTAHDTLTSSPESADDTLIRLTDLQRSQVTKLYQSLVKEWKEFEDLLRSTKSDLIKLESELVDTEEAVAVYEKRATVVEKAMSTLVETLAAVPPKYSDGDKEIHPLDGTPENLASFESALANAVAQIQSFDANEWKTFRAFVRELSPSVRQAITHRHGAIQTRYDRLEEFARKTKKKCNLFKRGMAFADIMNRVEKELMAVQETMDSSSSSQQKAVTDDAIQDLENRVAAVRTKIHGIKEEYYDLFEDPVHKDGFEAREHHVQERYKLVRDWVDQVRVWFIEAERIRNWIEARIRIINDREEDKEKMVDPLTADLTIDKAVIAKLHKEHDLLKREVDRFDTDDMARLRAHVKKLTAVDRSDKLSPADTSTIEITLETLNMLSTLKQLMQLRTQKVDMISLRGKWQELFCEASEWISNLSNEVDAFFYSDARCQPKESQAESIIQMLVGLETRVAEYDQGTYAQVLDAYQELEDLHGERLPDNLEQRQSAFEKSFEDLMKRVAFCRRTVEQYLAVAEVDSQFSRLQREGERLRKQMQQVAEGSSTDNADEKQDAAFGEQVQNFKDQSAYLVTEVVAQKVFYPQDVPETDKFEKDRQENEKANAAIHQSIQDYGMALAVLTEELEELLVGHRESMSLQERARLTYEDMMRMTAWFDERANNLLEPLPFDMETLMEEEPNMDELERLESELEGMVARIHQMENGDYNKLLQRVQALEDEIDATNAVAIDRPMLIAAVEDLEKGYQQLCDAMSKRKDGLIEWRKGAELVTHWETANNVISDTAHAIWEFVVTTAMYDPSKEQPGSSTSKDDRLHTLHLLEDKITSIDEQELARVKTAFNALRENNMDDTLLLKITDLEEKHGELKKLVQYASDALQQRSSVESYMVLFDQIVTSGKVLRDELEKASRRNETLENATERVSGFQSEARTLFGTKTFSPMEPTGFGERLQWDFDAIEPAEYHARVQDQINTLLESKRDELERLKRSIQELYGAQQSSNKMKRLIEQYDVEISELRSWVESRIEHIRQNAVDPLAETNIDEKTDDIRKLQQEIAEFEQSNIVGLQDNIAQLCTMPTLEMSETEDRLAEATSELDRLKSLVNEQLLALEAARKRIEWQELHQRGTEQLKCLNGDLRQITKQKDTTDGQATNIREQVTSWQQDLDEIALALEQLSNKEMADIDRVSRDLNQRLEQCHQTDIGLDARMDSLQHQRRRLEDNLATRRDEISLVLKRLDWEDSAQATLNRFSEQKKHADQFVRDEAYWRCNADIKQDTLRAHLCELTSKYQTLQRECTELQGAWDTLVKSAHALQDASYNLIVPESARNTVQELQAANANASSLLTFVDQIVNQHCQMSELMNRAAELEQAAEVISDELVNDKKSVERVEQYRKEVNEFCEQLAASIVYPVRSSSDVTSQERIQAESMNEVIRDTVATRTDRLRKMASALERSLESKENISRLQLQLQQYKQHAEACDEWIANRKHVIETHSQLVKAASTRALGMQELQHAVGVTRGIERALAANENSFTLLDKMFERCVATFEASEIQDEASLIHELDEITDSHTQTSDAWHTLIEDTKQTVGSLNELLAPTETAHKASKLSQSLDQLLSDIENADLSTLVDEDITQWQKQIDKLDKNEYQTLLQSDFARNNKSDNDDSSLLLGKTVEASITDLDAAGDKILNIRAKLTNLYDTVNVNRLCKTYSDNVATAQSMMDQVSESIEKTCEQFAVVARDNRVAQKKTLVAVHKEVQHCLTDCKDAYEDVCGYYSFLQAQGGTNEQVEKIHSQVQEQWQRVQEQKRKLSLLVSRTNKWIERYDALEKLHQAFITLQHDIVRHHSTNHSTGSSSMSRSLSRSSDSESHALHSMEKRLNNLRRDLEDIRPVDSNDEVNAAAFNEQWDRVTKLCSTLVASLSSRKQDLEKTALINRLVQEVELQRLVCEDQLSFLRQQSTSNPNIAEKKASVIQNVVQTYASALSGVRQTLDRCKNDAEEGSIFELACKLKQMHSNEVEVDRLVKPLSKTISDLSIKLQAEEDYIAALTTVYRHAQRELDILQSMNDFKATVSRFSRSARIARTKNSLLPDLAEFERRYNVMDKNVQDFYGQGSQAKSKIKELLGSARAASIARSVDRREENVRKEWARIRMLADDTRQKLHETQMRQHASAKITEAMRQVNEIKKRVNTLQLSGKSVSVEQQELKEIQHETQQFVPKLLKDVDNLLAGVPDKDGKMRRQRMELTALVQELRKLVQARLAEAEAEGNIALFVEIIDKMDEQITQLSKLVESCAPHNARVVQGRFNKGDLQQLLRSLVSGYKEREPRVGELVETAKAEARKQFVDHERVAEKLDRTLEHWTKVQSEAASRERELQTCINQLDHEFFTKLAMARSTSPKKAPTRRRVSDTRTARRQSFQSPTQATENRMANSRTPTRSSSRNRHKYVADPKNELDMQLGKIVNESPYQMKVRMVPNQVGKYWFGDEHPRLVYCRILPSKVVMVRVGGGWVELSK